MRSDGTNGFYKQHFLLEFFAKLSWKYLTDHTLQISLLIGPPFFAFFSDTQTVGNHSVQRIYPCAVWSCCLYQKAYWHKQCNFWPGFNNSLVSFLCSFNFSCETAEIRDVHHSVSISHFGDSKNKNKFCEIYIFRLHFSSHQVMGGDHK